jgi:hypothetical protein
MTEIEFLKKQLAEAKAAIASLTLQLNNVTLLYRNELLAGGKLLEAQASKEKCEVISN